MPQPGQRTLSFSLRARIGADYALAQETAGEWWLTRRGEPLLALRRDASSPAGTTRRTRSPRWRSARRSSCRSPPCSRSSRLSRTAAPLAVGGRGARRCATSTIRKAPTSGRRSRPCGGMRAPVVLIAGGEGKNQDFTPLGAGACAARCATPCSSAAPPQQIAAVLQGVCPIERCASLEEAVRAAARAAQRRRCRAAVPGLRKLGHVRATTRSAARVFEQACGSSPHEHRCRRR